MTSGLVKRMPLRNNDESCSQTFLKIGSRHCKAAFSLQVKSCTDPDPTLLYISILRIYSKFVRKINASARRLLAVAMPEC